MPDSTILWQVVGFLIVVVGAAIWVRSSVAKVRCTETERLAAVRKEALEDLRGKVSELEKTVERQQGQIDMLRTMKTGEIIDGVVDGLKPFVTEAKT